MCPVCWASFAAACAFFFVLSMLTVAGTDLFCLGMGMMLLATAGMHRFGSGVLLPWWWYAVWSGVLAARVVWLCVSNRRELIVSRVISKAYCFAKARCPRRQSQTLKVVSDATTSP